MFRLGQCLICVTFSASLESSIFNQKLPFHKQWGKTLAVCIGKMNIFIFSFPSFQKLSKANTGNVLQHFQISHKSGHISSGKWGKMGEGGTLATSKASRQLATISRKKGGVKRFLACHWRIRTDLSLSLLVWGAVSTVPKAWFAWQHFDIVQFYATFNIRQWSTVNVQCAMVNVANLIGVSRHFHNCNDIHLGATSERGKILKGNHWIAMSKLFRN